MDDNNGKNPELLALSKVSRTEEIDETFLIKFSKHPIMSCTEERRESFKGQEQKYKHCEIANIEDFVAAGLFYVGPEDNVRCFFCDGGLRNVQSYTIPFRDHKRYFPTCKFVLYGVKLEACTSRTPSDSKKASKASDCGPAVPPLRIPGRALEAREVKARLETSVIQWLMREGFQREYLKRAIERRFMLNGDDFSSAVDLIRDVLDVEGEHALPNPIAYFVVASSSITVSNGDKTEGTAATVVDLRVNLAAGRKMLGKDSLNLELEIAVSGQVKNMKTADVLHTLQITSVEDTELQRLWDEYQAYLYERKCKICFDGEINTVFLPCGHYVTCDKCCSKVYHCCICRALIRDTVLVQ